MCAMTAEVEHEILFIVQQDIMNLCMYACTVVAKIIRMVRFLNVLKEVSSAHQGFIYLIQNTTKTVIL